MEVSLCSVVIKNRLGSTTQDLCLFQWLMLIMSFPACLYLNKVKRIKEGNKASAENSPAATLLKVSSGKCLWKVV